MLLYILSGIFAKKKLQIIILIQKKKAIQYTIRKLLKELEVTGVYIV